MALIEVHADLGRLIEAVDALTRVLSRLAALYEKQHEAPAAPPKKPRGLESLRIWSDEKAWENQQKAKLPDLEDPTQL